MENSLSDIRYAFFSRFHHCTFLFPSSLSNSTLIYLFLIFFPSLSFLFSVPLLLSCSVSSLSFVISFFLPTMYVYFLSLYLFLLFFPIFCIFTNLRLRPIQELKCLSSSDLHELDIRNRVYKTII